MILPQDFKELLQLLKEHLVEYLIVGGYAVGAHGHPRYTGDLDIWINISDANAEKLMNVINEFGFSSLGIKKEDFLTPNNVIQLGFPPLRIDILTNIEGVDFQKAYRTKDELQMDGMLLNFINYNDLIINKSTTGRKQDEADVEQLRKNKK